MRSVLPRFGLYFGMNVCENCQFVIGYISISCDSVTHWLSDRPGTRDAYASKKVVKIAVHLRCASQTPERRSTVTPTLVPISYFRPDCPLDEESQENPSTAPEQNKRHQVKRENKHFYFFLQEGKYFESQVIQKH